MISQYDCKCIGYRLSNATKIVSNSVDHNAIQDGGKLLLILLKLRHLKKSFNLRLKGVWYIEVTKPGFVSNFCGGIVLNVGQIDIFSKLLLFHADSLPVDHRGDPAGRRLLQRGQHLPLSHHQDGVGTRHAQPVELVRDPKINQKTKSHIGNYIKDF